MPKNLEIQIFIFLVRYIVVVLLGLLAFTCDKLFSQYMCLTLITIHCLVCCRSPNQKPGRQPAQQGHNRACAPTLPPSARCDSSSSNNSRSSRTPEAFFGCKIFLLTYGKLGSAFTKPVLILFSICPSQRHFLDTNATSFFFLFHILPSIDATLS